MTPLISVIIVNYNAGARLQKCLDHLKAQSFKDFEVLIIDNGSEDGSADNLEAEALVLHVEFADENLGFAAGNNIRVQSAKGQWLAFLNPDAYAAPNWLEAFVAAAAQYPQCSAFGSTQIDALDQDKIDGAGDVGHILGLAYRGHYGWDIKTLPQTAYVFAPCAAAAFYKRDIFMALGGFDARFFCYGEDVDLGYRLRLSGRQVIQLKEAVVYHEGSAITGRHSDFTVYHGHRNRIWFMYKNTPFWLYWPFLGLHIFAHIYLLFRMIKVGSVRPYMRAIIDGYKGLGQFKADRRQLQRSRQLGYRDLIRAFTWSPRKIIRREGKSWPIL